MAVLHKLCLAMLQVHTQSSKIQNNEEGKAGILKEGTISEERLNFQPVETVLQTRLTIK